MNIGVLGTGMVGTAISTKLVELGHEVMMGSRTPGNDAAEAWAAHHRPAARTGTFAEAADFGVIVFNCTAGAGSVAAVTAAASSLAGKLLIDVSNPLDFSSGGPSLFVGIDDSLGERVQRAAPRARVVKSLNTMNASVMVDPASVPGDHVVFVCGDDPGAKADAAALLGQFGWPAARIVDAGDLTGARATEAYLLLWLRMMGAVGGAAFNIAIEQASAA